MKVVALTSDKGGMGKVDGDPPSRLRRRRKRVDVAVLDLDPQASVGRWARMRKKAGLPPLPLAETCVPIDVEDRLSELREAGPNLVFLDTAGRDNNAITAAITAADLIVVPCHPTDLELSTLGPTFARLKAEGKPHFVLLIDWSAGASRRRADATQAIKRAGGRVVPVPYTHRAGYRLALEQGQGVTEYAPSDNAAKEIRDVLAWLRTELSLAGPVKTKGSSEDNCSDWRSVCCGDVCRVDRIVPFAVEHVPSDMETIHLCVRDDDSLRVMGAVQFASHGKPGLGCGCCDQVDDDAVADERLGLPVHCDEGPRCRCRVQWPGVAARSSIAASASHCCHRHQR